MSHSKGGARGPTPSSAPSSAKDSPSSSQAPSSSPYPPPPRCAFDGEDTLPICAGSLTTPALHAAPQGSTPGMLHTPKAALGDEEGLRLPPGLPPVVDAHVHLFPDKLFGAIWRWFNTHGWPIRYALHTPEVIDFLSSRGVDHIIALHYAHKPGIAQGMNAYMAKIASAYPQVTGLGTVFPGEPGQVDILKEAIDSGLKGVKLHCHVQCMPPNDPHLWPVYGMLEDAGLPLVIHAGREPKSPAYNCDPHMLCEAGRIEAVLKAFPRLKVVVPHLGADEFTAYWDLVARYDTLWLDTTMVMGGFFASWGSELELERFSHRVLYGTDFPNLPYAWDREIKAILDLGLNDAALARLLGGNAAELYGIAL